ncbi:unnamed protein product [Brassicogethes aeneus]|uniref:RNA polymerase II subunit B1 CTD phosphatase RPAP2 homolog n=1 Tax=Brassicogethes aeneus TaxID=1431903 RepID=A0A9P0APC3_BRAAE|nr:unnamed protein product [Brassicogethes aeneus]
MQDSLEDYIQLSKNSKLDATVKNSKDIQLTAKLKNECDKRALKIVEFLLDGKLRPEIFLRCLPFINQEHYQDIVEERAIFKLCGYSICGTKIPVMPKQQYYISTKKNTIYDITDRKNYCSNFCYKASLHIKSQIDNSPLWLRKAEDVPDFNLLPSSEGGLPGEYIDQGISKPVVEPVFTTISTFTEASLDDIADREINSQKPNKSPNSFRKSSKLLKSTMQTINENNEQVEGEIEVEPPKKIPEKVIKVTKSDSNKQIVPKLPVIDENEEKSDVKENKEETNTPKKNKKKAKTTPKHNIESQIQKSLNEWFTLESYIFIFGEQFIKNLLSEKKLSSLFDTLHIEEMDQSHQIKYVNICKRLQLQEMADEKFDSSVTGKSFKPLPDYSKLKMESKDLDLKVKAFYSGALYEKEDSNFPSNKKIEEKSKEGAPAVLPLVDGSSQNALRRKIFLNSINKAMQMLLQALKVTSYSSVLSDVQALVKTFKLNATNIVFKPIIWNYISILILNILSNKDKELQKIIEDKRSQEHFELIFSSLPNKTKLLKDLLANIQNIDLFIENFIISKDL